MKGSNLYPKSTPQDNFLFFFYLITFCCYVFCVKENMRKYVKCLSVGFCQGKDFLRVSMCLVLTAVKVIEEDTSEQFSSAEM